MSGPVTAILADDEDLPRSELRRMLDVAWPELVIVAEVEHGAAAVEAIDELRPQVAFLDIRMPGRTGLDVARAASGRCHVVFTTAYDAHAIEAFAAGAVDYLLKPVQADRLLQTVQRLRERLAHQAPAADLGGLLRQLQASLPELQGGDGAAAHGAERLRWISASAGDIIKMFGIDEVLFFQSDEKYTRVVTASDEAHIRKPLREVALGLDDNEFWQVHRGTIVRANAIARAQRSDDGRITLHLKGHAEKLQVSQAWAWRFKPM